MSIDIAPPVHPSEARAEKKKKGFFSRLFGRKEETTEAPYDIDEIKRKLGLDDAPAAQQATPAAEPPAEETKETPQEPIQPPPSEPAEPPAIETQTFEIQDWTAEHPATKPEEPKAQSEWDKSHDEHHDDASTSPWTQDSQADSAATTTPPGDTPQEHALPGESEWAKDTPEEQREASPWEQDTPPELTAEHPTEQHAQEREDTGQAEDSGEAQHAEAQNDAGADTTAPAQETAGDEARPVQDSPAQDEAKPDFSAAAAAHFKDIEQEHRALHRELSKLIKEPRSAPENIFEKDAPPGAAFLLKNGQEVRNLKELLEALETIDDATYAHHVNEHRNDFAAWIQNILQQEDLAEQIRNKKAKEQLLRILKAHERRVLREIKAYEEELQKKLSEEQQAKYEELKERFDALKVTLARKSADLAHSRYLATGKAARDLEAELAKRLKDEREALAVARAEAEKAKQDYLQKLDELEGELRAAYEEKHAELEQHHSALTEQAQRLAEQEQRLAQERSALEELAGKAGEVKEAQEALARERAAFEEEKRAHEEELQRRRDEIEALHQEHIAQLEHEHAEKLRELDEERQRLRASIEEELAGERQSIQEARDALARERAQFTEERRAFAAEQEKVQRLKAESEERFAAAEQKERTAAQTMKECERERAKLAKQQERLAQLEEELRKREAELKEQARRLAEEKKAFEAHRASELARIEAAQRKLDLRIQKAEAMEQRIDEKLAEQRRIAAMMEEAEHEFAQHEKSLNSYLAAKVTDTTGPRPEDVKTLGIYQLLDEARAALDSGDVQRARRLYSSLREDFNKGSFPPEEKATLYKSLRELYDELHAR